MGISAWEIALIVLVILLLFGAKRVPEVARGLGRGLREFKESVTDHTKELKEATIETPKELKRALDPFADSGKDSPPTSAGEPEASGGNEREPERGAP